MGVGITIIHWTDVLMKVDKCKADHPLLSAILEDYFWMLCI